MTYANNHLILENDAGFCLEFNCLDALKTVNKDLPKHLKVGPSEDWLKARNDCQHSKVLKKPFDWTFTTDYKGTLIPGDGHRECLSFQDTKERINIEKLKVKEEIMFYDDVHLFEDELADHGGKWKENV